MENIKFSEEMQKFDSSKEPILMPDDRSTFFPIKYPETYDLYKKELRCFWNISEINLDRDPEQFKKFNDKEKKFIKLVLAFFASADTIVNMNLEDFTKLCKPIEINCFYSFQKMMENIHSEVYSLLLESYTEDGNEFKQLSNAIINVPAIKKKTDWVKKWIDNDIPFPLRLIAFAAVEGILFSGSFAVIFWTKTRGSLTGLLQANQFISRDEGLHYNFAIHLYKNLMQKPSLDDVKYIVTEAVSNEQEFFSEILPSDLVGMNSETMNQYIEFVADRMFTDLGFEKYYNKENPFGFMDAISIDGITNFFEKIPSEYKKMDFEEGDSFSVTESF